MAANDRLTRRVTGLEQENDRLRAYIRGMETAIRYHRVTVRNEVGK